MTTLGPPPRMASDAQLSRMDKPALTAYAKAVIAERQQIAHEYRALLVLCARVGTDDVAGEIAAHVAGAQRGGDG